MYLWQEEKDEQAYVHITVNHSYLLLMYQLFSLN